MFRAEIGKKKIGRPELGPNISISLLGWARDEIFFFTSGRGWAGLGLGLRYPARADLYKGDYYIKSSNGKMSLVTYRYKDQQILCK